MWYIVCFILGLLIGFIFCRFISKPKKITNNIGLLNVVESDDDPPYLFVELEEPVYKLYDKQVISMNVKLIRTNSQK